MRTWPALEVGRLQPAHTTEDASSPDVGAGFSRPDLFQAALVDYRIAAIDETTPDRWRVFFSTSADRGRAAENLTRQFPDLFIRPLDVPDEDWVAKSQADLRAVRVGNIIVAPPWDIPHTGNLKLDPATELRGTRLERPVVIVIRPSMGFGTGHHATTRLCLAALQRLDTQGQSVLDVGTGSGVLAIAASRLGAAPVVGIDDDQDALHAAEENLSLNRSADVTLRVVDLRSTGHETFDLVMANLTGALLTEAARRLHDLAAPGGRLILSGLMQHEEAAVLAAYSDLAISDRSEEEEWLCVSLQRP